MVFDTIIEDMPGDMFPDRPSGQGQQPKKTRFMNILKLISNLRLTKVSTQTINYRCTGWIFKENSIIKTQNLRFMGFLKPSAVPDQRTQKG